MKTGAGFKRNKTVFISIICFSALLFCAVSPAAPVNIIQSPLLTIPAIVDLSSNNTFQIDLKPGYEILNAHLVFSGGSNEITYAIDTGNTDSTSYIAYLKDSGIEPGLYGLSVTATDGNEGLSDIQPGSVWITDRIPDEITFAHLADTHVGDPRAGMSPSPLTPKERRLKVLRAATASGAHFLVITGDIVSVPGNYMSEYHEAYTELLETINIPMFLTPGNHDAYTTSATSPKADGLVFWTKYFGPPFYSFRVGDNLFVAINTYDWPRKARNFMNQKIQEKAGSYTDGAVGEDQYEWLGKLLQKEAAPGGAIICLGHHRPDDFAGTTPVPGIVPARDLLNLMAENSVGYFLAGHNHQNTKETVKGIEVLTVTSASAEIPEDASWGYNLCKLKSGILNCSFVSVVEQE